MGAAGRGARAVYGIAVYDSENVNILTWPHEVRWYPGRDRGRQSQRRRPLSPAYVCDTTGFNAMPCMLQKMRKICSKIPLGVQRVDNSQQRSEGTVCNPRLGLHRSSVVFRQIFKSPPEGAHSQRLQPRWSRCPCRRWLARPPAASTAPSPANPFLWIGC